MPPKLPQASDDSAEHDEALCATALRCAEEYVAHLPTDKLPAWSSVVSMLSRIRKLHAHNVNVFDAKTVKHLLRSMIPGGEYTLAFHTSDIHLSR